ncbi:hypothetical protein QO010_000031 [Caulobacter ginsengisoli]|uniref:Metal-dependent hydrolase n=1 Tax=Caulobacter ginsengisoli TaxID=400775 RepID=A0ABU0IMC1_9CAUL|nr:hypothetical protein [Caulobacter ginsengisoli]MDQ0462283.1 hypothetical protein [Caulobacter ginsengisoli]
MFVGHYSAALAAKAVEPRGPLWTYVAAAQLLDIGWSSLVMAGVEKVRFDPELPGSFLVLDYMPFTHSLPAAVLWSLAGMALSRWLLRLNWRAAVLVGLVVFSHWIGDFLVHRPDLELLFMPGRVGLSLWDYPEPELLLEAGLIALSGAAWLWRRGREGRSIWPGLIFLTLLLALQAASLFALPAGTAAAFGRTSLGIYLVVAAIAALCDLGKPRVAAS